MLSNDEEKDKLVHFGVLGMRWGHRSTRAVAGPSSAFQRKLDRKHADAIKKKNENGGLDLRSPHQKKLDQKFVDAVDRKNGGNGRSDDEDSQVGGGRVGGKSKKRPGHMTEQEKEKDWNESRALIDKRKNESIKAAKKKAFDDEWELDMTQGNVSDKVWKESRAVIDRRKKATIRMAKKKAFDEELAQEKKELDRDMADNERLKVEKMAAKVLKKVKGTKNANVSTLTDKELDRIVTDPVMKKKFNEITDYEKRRSKAVTDVVIGAALFGLPGALVVYGVKKNRGTWVPKQD